MIAALEIAIAEGRVPPDAWSGAPDGRRSLALHLRDAGINGWILDLAPWIGSQPCDEHRDEILRRVAAFARRWPGLDDAARERARAAAMRAIVAHARTRISPSQVACCVAMDAVLEWLEDGGNPASCEWCGEGAWTRLHEQTWRAVATTRARASWDDDDAARWAARLTEVGLACLSAHKHPDTSLTSALKHAAWDRDEAALLARAALDAIEATL